MKQKVREQEREIESLRQMVGRNKSTNQLMSEASRVRGRWSSVQRTAEVARKGLVAQFLATVSGGEPVLALARWFVFFYFLFFCFVLS